MYQIVLLQVLMHWYSILYKIVLVQVLNDTAPLYQVDIYCRFSLVQHTVPGSSILQVLPCTAHCTRVFYCRFSLVTSEGERKEGDTCLVDISGPMCFQVHMLTIPVWGEILKLYYLQKARKLQIQIFLVKLFL